MDECIWIITIKNCDYKYYISNIIGLTVNFIFFILNLFLLYFYIQKKEWNFDYKKYNRIFEFGFINVISISIIKIIYFLLLLFKVENYIIINILNDICMIIITFISILSTLNIFNIVLKDRIGHNFNDIKKNIIFYIIS